MLDAGRPLFWWNFVPEYREIVGNCTLLCQPCPRTLTPNLYLRHGFWFRVLWLFVFFCLSSALQKLWALLLSLPLQAVKYVMCLLHIISVVWLCLLSTMRLYGISNKSPAFCIVLRVDTSHGGRQLCFGASLYSRFMPVLEAVRNYFSSSRVPLPSCHFMFREEKSRESQFTIFLPWNFSSSVPLSFHSFLTSLKISPLR